MLVTCICEFKVHSYQIEGNWLAFQQFVFLASFAPFLHQLNSPNDTICFVCVPLSVVVIQVVDTDFI